jgi:hypothetical protein
MANPNIVNVSDIRGKTAVQSIGTSASAIVENASSSGKILKINSLIVSNIDGTNVCDISAYVVRSATNYALASTITVPADATLVVISKDTAIYLEEGDSITLLASAVGDLQAICSYEEIS